MDSFIEKLSSRETEIIHWVSLGKTNWEIGVILDISIYTVKNHIKNILRKLNSSNRTQAAQKAYIFGMIAVDHQEAV